MKTVPVFDRNRQVVGTFRDFMHIMFSAPRTEQNLAAFRKTCREHFYHMTEAEVQALNQFDESVTTCRVLSRRRVAMTGALDMDE